jgi:hypothetical protein
VGEGSEDNPRRSGEDVPHVENEVSRLGCHYRTLSTPTAWRYLRS